MSTFYGLAASRSPGQIESVRINTTGLKQYAVVIWDSAQAGKSCKAPTAAGNTGVAGVIIDELDSSGTVSGSYYNIQKTGKCPVLLDAGQAVTVGGYLQVSDTDGSVKALGTTDQCDVVGKSCQTLTAGSANNPIMVDLNIFYVGDNVP